MRVRFLIAVSVVVLASQAFAAPPSERATPTTTSTSPLPQPAPLAVPNAVKQPLPTMYSIYIKISETNAAGKVDLISRPQVMTVEGQPAVIQIGGNAPLPESLGPTDDLLCGNSARLTVRRGKNQQLVLDASFEMRRDELPAGERVVITTRGVRVVEPIVLGRAMAVAIPNDAGRPALMCEFTVYDASKELREAELKRVIRK